MNFPLAAFRLSNQLGSIFTPTRTVNKAGKLFLTPKRHAIKEWEQVAEKSGQRFNISPEVSAIRWQPLKQNSYATGAPPILLPILLVHGWESRATQMYGIAKEFLNIGYEVVAVDMPAHGHSKGTSSNPNVFAQTITLAQQQLGAFEAIIGHSMGAGATAIAIGRGVTTQKMVLISGPSSIENVLRRFAGFIGLNKKSRDRFVDFISNFVGATPNDLDSQLLLRDCKIPALLIHDEGDLEVPASESKRLAAVLENGQLHISHGLGHRKILKSDVILEKIVNFIKH